MADQTETRYQPSKRETTMTTTTSRIYDGTTVIYQSANLRGLLDHARRRDTTKDGRIAPYSIGVTRAYVTPLKGGRGHLTVFYGNGTIGHSDFQSFHVACDWVRSRRSWNLRFSHVDHLGKVYFV